MSLPIQATEDDVRSIIAYLKNKPTGATPAEAKAAVKKPILDSRKLAAYRFWDIITKDTDRLKLAKRGWEIARGTKTEGAAFSEIANSVTPYRSVLEWAFHQNMEALNTVDVASHWHEHHQEASGTKNDATLTAQAVSFFHVAQAAGLGKLLIGRRGQQTRLELAVDDLKAFVEGGPELRRGSRRNCPRKKLPPLKNGRTRLNPLTPLPNHLHSQQRNCPKTFACSSLMARTWTLWSKFKPCWKWET